MAYPFVFFEKVDPLHTPVTFPKDGTDLPAAQVKSSVAEMRITVGETYDVEVQADHPGAVQLQIWLPSFPVRVTQPLTFAAAI